MQHLRNHAALFFTISLALAGCIPLISARHNEERLIAIAFIILALVFFPIGLVQRKGK